LINRAATPSHIALIAGSVTRKPVRARKLGAKPQIDKPRRSLQFRLPSRLKTCPTPTYCDLALYDAGGRNVLLIVVHCLRGSHIGSFLIGRNFGGEAHVTPQQLGKGRVLGSIGGVRYVENNSCPA